MRMPAKNSNSGVTLIELMIVIVIAAILLAIGIPAFQDAIDRNRLKAAAENLYGDLQFAKTEAIKRNRTVRLVFMPSGGGATWCYGLRENATCDCTVTDAAAADYCAIDNAKKVVSSTDFPNVTIPSASTDQTSFTPLRGTADNGTVIFESARGKEIRVIVSTMGRIRSCSPSGSENVPGYLTPCP
jgi:type IV fimbrial biogenesis protein FimT